MDNEKLDTQSKINRSLRIELGQLKVKYKYAEKDLKVANDKLDKAIKMLSIYADFESDDSGVRKLLGELKPKISSTDYYRGYARNPLREGINEVVCR